MENMSPHDTFSLESFILNFQIFAPKCLVFSPINLGAWLMIFFFQYMSELLPSLQAFSLPFLDLSRIDTLIFLFTSPSDMVQAITLPTLHAPSRKS